MREFATRDDAMAAADKLASIMEAAAGGEGGCVVMLPARIAGRVSMMCHVIGPEPLLLARQALETLARWILNAESMDMGVVGEVPNAHEYAAGAMAVEALRGQAKGILLLIHRADDTNGALGFFIDADVRELIVLAEKGPAWAREWAQKTIDTVTPATTGRGEGGGAN